MTRPLRIAFPGALEHLTVRGNIRLAVFPDDVDRGAFLSVPGDLAERSVAVAESLVRFEGVTPWPQTLDSCPGFHRGKLGIAGMTGSGLC